MQTQATLFGRAYQVLQDRQRWESKQRLYYQMRHDGLRRRNKPFPTAADLHLALIDESITKLKPFWLAQALGSDHLATFVAMRQQLKEQTESARDFFDFELKQRSDFLRKLETVADTMLLRGRGVLKNYVDPYNGYKLVFENVDPLYIIMRETANDFEDADEFVHVRQMSVAKYQRDRRYMPNSLDKIRGGNDSAQRMKASIEKLRGAIGKNFEMIYADKELREGIIHSPQDDTIILWEHYVRTMGGLTVYTYAPVALEVEVRKPYGVASKVNGKVSVPFFSFVAEVKDEGWYSPRGIAEKIAAHELYGCKVWNEKADAMTFFNRPMLTSETPIQNPANYRVQPGEYMPGNMKFIQNGAPSMSFDQEIYFARGEAEQAIQMPDFGIQQTGQGGGSEPRTATENKRIASLQNTGTNHNAQIFRTDLCKVYRHSWGLMLQYKRKELTYFVSQDLKTMPDAALHDQYFIMPGGSTDEWDRALRLQKAGVRYETFKGDPGINQDELKKDLLAADDARLVSRLLMPQNMKAATESEDEANEISTMIVTHYPAPVMPGEDHLTRVKMLLNFLQAQGQTGAPVDPMARQRIQEHLAVHLNYLKELQPQVFRQVIGIIQRMEAAPMPAPTAGTGTQPPAAAPEGQPAAPATEPAMTV